MKKNEFYEGMVTSLKFPNKGIVYVEDEDAYVQVKNTLPGQPTSLPGDKIGKRYGEEASAYLLINRRIPAVIPTRIKVPVFLRRYTISSPYRFAVVKRAISAKGMPQDK